MALCFNKITLCVHYYEVIVNLFYFGFDFQLFPASECNLMPYSLAKEARVVSHFNVEDSTRQLALIVLLA
jgi:hypothetical protein